MPKTIKGFKAFKKGLICKDIKFEEGKTYETDKAKICQSGFHLCRNPLDVLDYYDLCESEFAEAEALGKIDTHKEDSKIATTKIKIGMKLSLKAFIEASVNFLLTTCKSKKTAASEHSSKLAASGYSSQLAASGDSSQLAASGDSSQLELSGENCVGAGIGINNKIKGKKGNWITLAEWIYDDNKKRYIPICVKSAQIDNISVFEDKWYQLKNGEFIEV